MMKEHKVTLLVTLFSEKEFKSLSALLQNSLILAVEDCLNKNNLNSYLHSDVKFQMEIKND